MEDEPREGHECSFRNTQRIIVISSALKASITAIIKKTPTLSPKIPLRKILRKETPQQNRGASF